MNFSQNTHNYHSQVTPNRPFQPRVLILDDDPIICRVFTIHLLNAFPGANIECSHEPIAKAGYDVYFVDNDFEGIHMGENLIEKIKELSPEALVVCLSATVTPEKICSLISKGCNLVYDKAQPQNSHGARDIINGYLEIIEKATSRQ